MSFLRHKLGDAYTKLPSVSSQAMADVERAAVATLEKQYAELLAPLKDLLVPKKFSLQYMQKLTRRQKPTIYLHRIRSSHSF